MATIPTIQLFRNSIIKTGRQAAIDALEAQKASVPDGGLILARYSKDGTENGVKTLLGIVRNSGSANAELTVIDVEGAAKNVQEAITSAINKLNKGDAEVEGQYVSSVSEANGIITVTRKPLPSFDEKTASGKAITAITQTNGEVSVKFGGVAAANVSVADEGNKFTATNVEDTLLEIKTSLDNAIGAGGTVEEQITNAINGISGTTEITDGKVITAISQTKGKVSVSTATLGADKVSASAIESSDTTVAVTGTKVSEQIASLAKSIKTVSTDAKTYSISSIIGNELTALGANVKEAYKLVDEDGVKAGDIIKIYKDSSLKEAKLDGQTLKFTYILADETEQTVEVDVSTFLAESEFSDGLEVVDHVVKVKKAEGSEGFLTVGADGVKLDGVQAAINTAAASAKTKVEKASDATHITVTPTTSDVDGSVTYTIGESDIASAALLGTKEDASTAETAFGRIAKEVADRQAAIAALDLTQVGGNGQVITTISQTAGKVSVTAATLGAENVSASTINSSDATVAVTGDNVKAQIESLAKSIKSASTAAAAAHTKVEAKTDGHVTVSIAKSEDGSHDIVTIAENDIASATDLGTETTNRQNADTALSDRLGDGVTTTATVTAQLQVLSGSSTSDTSDTISVIGAKKYTDAKVEALGLTQVGGADKVITTISQSNGQVSASAIDLTANNVKATASSSSATAVAVDGATVEAQIASLATSIKSVSTTAAAAHTRVTAKPSGHVTVEVSNDGSHDVVTIAENDIASATDLGTETTARQNQDDKIEASIGLAADGSHVTTTGNYTSGATTVVGEIAALDTKLKEVSDTLGTGVTTAEGKTVTEQLQSLSGSSIDGKDVTSVYGAKAYAKDLVDNLNAEVGSTTGTSKTEAIKIVQTKGKIASITLGAFDCGTY